MHCQELEKLSALEKRKCIPCSSSSYHRNQILNVLFSVAQGIHLVSSRNFTKGRVPQNQLPYISFKLSSQVLSPLFCQFSNQAAMAVVTTTLGYHRCGLHYLASLVFCKKTIKPSSSLSLFPISNVILSLCPTWDSLSHLSCQSRGGSSVLLFNTLFIKTDGEFKALKVYSTYTKEVSSMCLVFDYMCFYLCAHSSNCISENILFAYGAS